MVPGYFDVVMTVVYMRLQEHVFAQMGRYVEHNTEYFTILTRYSLDL